MTRQQTRQAARTRGQPPRARTAPDGAAASPARPTALPVQSEAAWMRQVVQAATLTGWVHWHLPPCEHNRRSTAGLPDLILLHPERRQLVFLELKRVGKKPTWVQAQWLDALSRVERTWSGWATPNEWPQVEAVLTGRSEAA